MKNISPQKKSELHFNPDDNPIRVPVISLLSQYYTFHVICGTFANAERMENEKQIPRA